MRLHAVPILLGCCSLSFADRLIDIPTARKIAFEMFRIEYAGELSSGRTQLGYLDVGIGTSFEASLRTERIMGGPTVGAFDLSYNYLAPLAGISPGFSFGVLDVANQTQDGRRAFGCTTFRLPLETVDGEVSADLTLGGYFRKSFTPYLGCSIPFSKMVRLLAEHDGFRVAAGLEVRPTPSLGLRFYVRGRDTVGSVSWTAHF